MKSLKDLLKKYFFKIKKLPVLFIYNDDDKDLYTIYGEKLYDVENFVISRPSK
jgi:hypothetical protein